MKKKNVKKIIVVSVILVVLILLVLTFMSLFGTNTSKRLDGSNKYKLTNNEINKSKEAFSTFDVKNIKMYVNNKTIKVFVNLKEEEDIKEVKKASDEVIKSIKKKNLEFYDVEIVIDVDKEDSDNYPIIGHKHKSAEGFVW